MGKGESGGGSSRSTRKSKASAKANSRPSKKDGKGKDEDGGEPSQIVYTEPVLIGPAHVNAASGRKLYLAVDYENKRYNIGDHVALYAGGNKEWCMVIEELYSDEEGTPMFTGRWFWNMSDVELHRQGAGQAPRKSKLPKFELISSDNRDENPVEVISRRCHVLSWRNFKEIQKKNRAQCEGLYFCDRMYYHKAHKFQELTHLTFPGDAIPSYIRPAPPVDCDADVQQEGDHEFLRVPRDDNLNTDNAHRNPRITQTDPRPDAPSIPEDNAATTISTYFLC